MPRTQQFFCKKLWWPGYINELRKGDSYDELADTQKWPLVYVDEIGATRDTTGYVADQLYVLLAQRDKKWTIITTNLTLEQISAMDNRIFSRCLRNNGIVIEVKAVDFNTRNK